MAKKTRIDRRGKIRSIVRKFPTGNKPHWSITKRAAVWERRRIIDDVWLADVITVTDSILVSFARDVNETITMSDAVALNNEKLLLSSTTVQTDTVEKHAKPSSTDSMTITDSVGLDMQSLNTQFNNFSFNFCLFNGIGYDQEFYTDSVTMSDSVSLHASKPVSETVSVSDSIGFVFDVSSIFNADDVTMNLSQFNN
tara:strand:+ start:830 stop:1420 length:591 start_codon:yes stop_codon:yes gene_type:complete